MLSRTTEYALRAATALAGRPERALLSRELAEITGVSTPYLKKVLRLLARSALVRSQPGPGGGFTLARAPERISLLDVIRAVEPIQRIERCPLRLQSHTELCRLHRRIDDALASIETAFESTSLASVVRSLDGPTPLCTHAPPRKP